MYYPSLLATVRPFQRTVDNPLDLSLKPGRTEAQPRELAALSQQMPPMIESTLYGSDAAVANLYCSASASHNPFIASLPPPPSLIDASALSYHHHHHHHHMRVSNMALNAAALALNSAAYQRAAALYAHNAPLLSPQISAFGALPQHMPFSYADILPPAEPSTRFADHLQQLRQHTSPCSAPCCVSTNALSTACNCCSAVAVAQPIVPSAAAVNSCGQSLHKCEQQLISDTSSSKESPKLWNTSNATIITCDNSNVSECKAANTNGDKKCEMHTSSNEGVKSDTAEVIIIDSEESTNNTNDKQLSKSDDHTKVNVNDKNATQTSTTTTSSTVTVTVTTTSITTAAMPTTNATAQLKRQLKDYKPLSSKSVAADNANSKSVTSQRQRKETKTVEVQVSGPDWTPIVLSAQLKSKLLSRHTKSCVVSAKHIHSTQSPQRKRSMLQCLLNSDGYVADKVRCVAARDRDLNVCDPSQLDREERALQVRMCCAVDERLIVTDCHRTQRAMKHFEQLERPNQNQNHTHNQTNHNHIHKHNVSHNHEKESNDHKSEVNTIVDIDEQQQANERKVDGNHITDKSTTKQRKSMCSGVRRRRFRSGLDMIRQPQRKKKSRITTNGGESANRNRKISCGESSLRTEMKRLMVNKALGETLLHRAARSNRKDVVRYCLESSSCDINARDNAGYTPLHECCTRGHLEIARSLLQRNADVNASAAGGIRPLHDAVENNHIEVVRLLLSYGADPNISTYSGSTPLKLSRSRAMTQFLKGYINDLSGKADAEANVNTSEERESTIESISWRFRQWSHSQNYDNCGFDVFANIPSDGDDSDCDEDLLFEASDRPFDPTYRLAHSENCSHVMRLSDALWRMSISKEEFVRTHSNIKIISVARKEFERATICQLLATNRAESVAERYVDVIQLDDNLRTILGIEMTRLR